MEITVPKDLLDVLIRIATAAEDLRGRANENYNLAKQVHELNLKSFELQEKNAALCAEDIEFRRQKARAGEAEKQMFLQMMFGGKMPGANEPAPPAPGGPGGDAEPPIRRRRHT